VREPASDGVQWFMPGVSVYRWDHELDEWHQVRRTDERPCEEALWFDRNLLLGIANERWAYEWTEGEARFKMER
jgi:hypothetical protein